MSRNKQLDGILAELKQIERLLGDAEVSLVAAGGESEKFDPKKGIKKAPRWGLNSTRLARIKVAKLAQQLTSLKGK
jgi:hypothetical protein